MAHHISLSLCFSALFCAVCVCVCVRVRVCMALHVVPSFLFVCVNCSMLSQWRGHRHICENYSPHKTADDHGGDCSGTKFYHWGALTGMITLIEEGFY